MLSGRIQFKTILSRTFVPAWLALFVCFAAFAFAEWQNRTIHHQAMRAKVHDAASLLQSRLEGLLTADLQLVRGLVAVVAADTDISQDRFSDLAERVIGGRKHIRNVAVAPGLVVRMVHPVEANRAVIGLDYNQNVAQRTAALQARDTGEMILAGPVQLIQGGSAFIGRFPIFAQESGQTTFWGILSVVLDEAAIYEDAGLDDPAQDLRLALRGTDATGAAGNVFYGSAALFEADPVLLDILLPTGSWQLAAIPKDGWHTAPDNVWILRIILCAVGLLVVVPAFLVCSVSAHRNEVIDALQTRERELAEKRDELLRLSMLAQNASDSIIVTEDGGRISWVNHAFEEMTGYPPEEAIGKNVGDLLNGPETDQDTISRILDHVTTGRRLRTEILNYTRSGEKIWVETHQVPVVDDSGEVAFTIAVERDVTAAKQNAQELERAKSAAESADRAKSEFLANMSHEIRTPMNGIIGMAEVLSEMNIPPESQDILRTIRQSAHSLLGIINDILDLSRLDAQKLELSNENFDLLECVEGAFSLLRLPAQDKGLLLTLDVADGVPKRVLGDAGRLRQVLLNLLGNAVKFTARGSVSMRVTADKANPYRIYFDVEDTGIGLTPEQMARIFDPFSQADAAITRKFGGTGLGLAISLRLVENMNGTITVQSELGQGACFRVETELAPPEVQAPEPERITRLDPSEMRGCRILLAEDNKTNRLLVHKFLDPLGVFIWDAADGLEAVEMFQTLRPDVVLMDMSMPGLDGLEATRRIRALDLPQPPIIALTANAFASDREACLKAGMNAFLSKPFGKKGLVSTILGLIATEPVLEADLPRHHQAR